MHGNRICGLHRFEERDIDTFLAEELRVNAAFAAWFIERIDPTLRLQTPALRTRASVVEDGSEADVIACFADGRGGVHRIYIEDKITAPMMPEQLERYLRRAGADAARDETSGYSVVLFAPASYFARLPEAVTHITFEEAAAALRQLSDDLRSRYRASFLEAAAPILNAAARDAQVIETDPFIVTWWEEVYRMLDREFPDFFLPPRTRYPRSVYFAPRTAGMPEYLRVDFKGHKGEVDLAFKGMPFRKLADALAGVDIPGQLVENRESTAIRISGLPPFRIADGSAVIDTHVRAAYAAARTLLVFWKDERQKLESWSSDHA